MHFRYIFLLILIAFCGSSISAKGKFAVVIDPGHGGRDPGALRGKIKEKDITLDVSLLVGKLIESNHKDVKVIYTRKTDETLILADRAKKANNAKANLFISIHVNSSKAKETKAKGTETYILGVPKNAEDQALAKFENSVILLEENYESRYEGFDPNSTELHIMSEFMSNKYRDQSINLASEIQNGFKNKASRYNRGVKENFFLVLRHPTMPSVLVEMGFINNKEEAEYMISKAGQKSLSEAIYFGFKKYKQEFDKHQGNTKVYTAKDTTIDKEVDIELSEPIVTVSLEKRTGTAKIETVVIKTVEAIVKQLPIDKPKADTVATKGNIEQAKPKSTEQPKVSVVTPKIKPGQVEIRVQFAVSRTPRPHNSPTFKGLSPVDVYKDSDGVYKYTYGSTTDENEAINMMRRVRAKFPDAFVVRFMDGKRIK